MRIILVNTGRRSLHLALVASVLASSLLLATGCAAATPNLPRPRVVAAFYPFAWIAERVLGGKGSVTNLTQPGAEPHDLELTARQVTALSTADLVLYQHGFQPAVDEAVKQAAPSRAIDFATLVKLVPGEDEEHHEALDPHTWLDPVDMVTFVRAVATALAEVDSPNAATYAANGDKLVTELKDLDAAYRQGLANCVRREFVTTHGAFGYLAARYGLQQIGISGINPDLEPSPARIAEIHQQARTYGVTTIFSEVLASPAMAEAIAGDLRLTTDLLDPLEGITAESRGTDYLEVMRSNLAALRKANACT